MARSHTQRSTWIFSIPAKSDYKQWIVFSKKSGQWIKLNCNVWLSERNTASYFNIYIQILLTLHSRTVFPTKEFYLEKAWKNIGWLSSDDKKAGIEFS